MRNRKKRIKNAILSLIFSLIIILIVVVQNKEFFINFQETLEKQSVQKIEKNIDEKDLEEEQEQKKKEHLKIERKLTNITHTALFCSLPILLLSIIINFKNVHTKSYDKNYENQIDPILAEILIDNEIDFKSLIMTTIIELHLKGNLRIINNEYIELLNTKNIEPYQEKMLNLIFGNKKVITFKEINNAFKKSKEKTFEFSIIIAFIKQNIIEKLYNMGIYSRKKTAIAKVITIFSIIIIINLPMMMIMQIYSFLKEFIAVPMAVTGFVIYFYIKKMDNQVSFIESFTAEGKIILEDRTNRVKKRMIETMLSRLLILATYPITIILLLIALFNYSIEIILLVILIFVLNICVFILNKGYCLTNKGYEEKYKLLKLKNYINEYSLIKDRDLNSVLVWDEYLAYATAFEIPSKVTDSIYEHWYDVNITIQFMETVTKLLFENYNIS